MERHTDKQEKGQTDIKQTESQTDNQPERKTDTHVGKQTVGQRQTDSHVSN